VKAAVCWAFGAPLEIEELQLDSPQRGEVRVRVAACTICRSDIDYAQGAWGGTLPAVYGHEAAGVVSEVGQGVSRVQPGDRVAVSLLRSCGACFFCVRGQSHLCEHEFPADRDGRLRTEAGEPVLQAMHTAAFAEEVVVDESQLAVVPATLGFEAASLLGCGVVTGFGAVTERAAVHEGASVVVIGTGGVGLNAVQGAALSGAGEIVVVDPSPAKREAAVRFGATQAVDPYAGDPAADARAVTGGRGADYVFVTVGRTDAIEQGLACVRRGGTLVVVGMPPAGESFRVVAVDLAHDDVRILGSKMGSARLAEAVPRLVDLYEQGRLQLDELISARYPLERINDAIATAEDPSTLRTVIVFDAE
jgi:S-(hydroxymethyl)glutathione dehydrogenase / alcohol dehydrogenase